MAKFKKTAALLSALLLCSSLLVSVACNKGGGNNGTTSSLQESSVSEENSSSDVSEEPQPEPSVFALENHTWTGWETVTAATCTTDGEEKLVCTDEGCGKIKTRTIKAGHLYGEWTGDLSELCTKDAQLTRTCSTCGGTESQTVAMRGHAYDNGVCKICDEPFTFPQLQQNPSYVDAWDTSIRGVGEAFDRKHLNINTYYTMEVPPVNPDMGNDGVWISVPADGPGQYALLTIGGTNGVTIERFDANDFYIPGNEYGYLGYAATEHENGESYSIVSCSELHYNEVWRATWRFSTETATTVKFVIVKIAPPEWIPEYLHESPIPKQIKNVTASNAPDGYTAVPVDYNDSYYFDEWNEVYRRGTKNNPGEVIYVAISKTAERLFGEKSFSNIQEDGNNLSLSNGTDERGNYLIRDYHAFLLDEESANGNAYENFVNADGMYHATKELQEFLHLYTQKNRPIDIPVNVWDNETERAKKAWLAPCYYYRELTPGTEDNPNVIDKLGDFEASPAAFDMTYFTINLQDDSGAPVFYLTLSCEDSNARININGKTYSGPFSVKFEVNTTKNTTFFVASKDGTADTFTLTLSAAGEGSYSAPITIEELGETSLTPTPFLGLDGTIGYDGYYQYVVTEACTLTLTTATDAYLLFGEQALTDGSATVVITEDMLGENGYALSIYVSAESGDPIAVTIAKN